VAQLNDRISLSANLVSTFPSSRAYSAVVYSLSRHLFLFTLPLEYRVDACLSVTVLGFISLDTVLSASRHTPLPPLPRVFTASPAPWFNQPGTFQRPIHPGF
jgi:hypothetical protein